MKTVLLFFAVSAAANMASAASIDRMNTRTQAGAAVTTTNQSPIPIPSTAEVDRILASTAPAAAPMAFAGCPSPDAVFLPSGAVFWAKLTEAIWSYNLAAPVTADIEADVKFLDRVVIPRGSTLFGAASTQSWDRVNVTWQLVVMPKGCEFPISAIALDASDGAAGLQGVRVEHQDSIAAHIAIKSALLATGAAAVAATPVGSLESSLASNFTSEAGQNVDKDLANVKSLASIYVKGGGNIRVRVLRRYTRPGEGR